MFILCRRYNLNGENQSGQEKIVTEEISIAQEGISLKVNTSLKPSILSSVRTFKHT